MAQSFERHHFAARESWDPAARRLTTEHTTGAIPLAGLTLHVVRYGVWTDDILLSLHGLGAQPRPPSVSAPPAAIGQTQAVTPAEVAALLAGRRCVVFTGAGISRAAGVPDFATFDFSAAFGLAGPPLNEFVQALVCQPAELLERCRKAFVVEPTPAHRALKQLHELYPFLLVTGNIDGLHEATGLEPAIQASDTQVQFDGLRESDVLITVGISHDGIGPVAKEFRRLRPSGQVIALDLATPAYLEPGDGLLQGDLQQTLPEIARQAKAEHEGTGYT